MTLEELFQKYPEVVDQMLHDFNDEVEHNEYDDEFTVDAMNFLSDIRAILWEKLL